MWLPTPMWMYFNPRSPHGERPRNGRRARRDGGISIHAPRTGSDVMVELRLDLVGAISIHAPRTGSDTFRAYDRSAWRYFNPRSPHGERHAKLMYNVNKQAFQSTLPARGATGRHQRGIRRVYFNPRSPHGERPFPSPDDVDRLISIHAPRTGSDGS